MNSVLYSIVVTIADTARLRTSMANFSVRTNLMYALGATFYASWLMSKVDMFKMNPFSTADVAIYVDEKVKDMKDGLKAQYEEGFVDGFLSLHSVFIDECRVDKLVARA